MQVKHINYQTQKKVFTDLRNSSQPHVFNTVPMNGLNAKVSGRPPIFRIEKDGLQIALWNPRSGRFSFSKAVLPILEACNALPRVGIDF